MLVLFAVVLLTAEENLGVTCLHSSFSETEKCKGTYRRNKVVQFCGSCLTVFRLASQCNLTTIRVTQYSLLSSHISNKPDTPEVQSQLQTCICSPHSCGSKDSQTETGKQRTKISAQGTPQPVPRFWCPATPFSCCHTSCFYPCVKQLCAAPSPVQWDWHRL